MPFHKGISLVIHNIFKYDKIPDSLEERESFANEIWEQGAIVWSESKRKNRKMNIAVLADSVSYKEYENTLSKYIDRKTEKSYMFAVGRNNLERFCLYNEELTKMEWTDFEFIKIPVPYKYEVILNRCYGNWKEYVKGTALHGDVGDIFYDTEHPYEYYIYNDTNMNIVKIYFGI